jgi:hypothetical protein
MLVMPIHPMIVAFRKLNPLGLNLRKAWPQRRSWAMQASSA